MEPNRREFQKQCVFQSFCKRVLHNEACNAHDEIRRRRKREVSFCDLALHEERQLYTTDKYFQAETAEPTYQMAGKEITPKLLLEAIRTLPEEKRTVSGAAGGITLNQLELLQTLMAKKAALEKLSAASSKLASELSGLLDDVADAAKYTSELTDSLEMLTEDTAALYDSMDSYYPDLQASLDDTEELLNRTTEAMNTSISTAAIVQNTLKNSSDNLDAATRDSIRGTLELLDKSLSVLDSTASIRHAGVTMKEAIDKEWDDLDGDTRFLNMDPKAEKVSFTSDENQEPESVQIILRTAEISLDDDDEVLDAETEAASQSPLRRIWIVIVKMWKAFVEIFRNR